MWVFCGGMFRSGSTLQYQLVSEITERAGRGVRVPWVMPEEFLALAESYERRAEFSARLHVFKTHVCKHAMRERLRDGNALAVRVHRDLRDIAVSGARKAGRDPTPEYCRELAEGCMACEDGWSERTGVRSWSYEALIGDTTAVCTQMAHHLDVRLDAGAAEALAAEFSPTRQQARIESALRDGGMVTAVEGYDTVHMDRELLHPNHIVDGRIGIWKESLPTASIRVIEAVAGDWLQRNGYELSRGAA